MRKKLDTRFPAPRIKKIMQADEDVGKIAMAVPLLVSKALELFLQDLCDRTYEITIKKGAKTVNSMHLKECVHGCNVFDFLRDTVSCVPDLGSSDAVSEDVSTIKRRKISEGECGNDNEFAKTYIQETGHTSNTGRGRGKGQGRGRVSRTLQSWHEKFEDDPDMSKQNIEDQQEHMESLNTVARTADEKETDKPIVNFDLNVDLNENMDSTQKLPEVPVGSPMKLSPHTKPEDVPGWSVEDLAMMAINPVHLASINKGMDEVPKDYDTEG